MVAFALHRIAGVRGLATRLVIGLGALLIGCEVEPKYAGECRQQCATAAECASDQVCADGWCVYSDREACFRPDIEPTPDAASACAADCRGECDRGVCVIACDGKDSCSEAVACPSTGPCRVDCTGQSSCKGGVRCGADECDVLCAGKSSCEHDMMCSTGRCRVMCTGDDSCKDGVHCERACACDVTCVDEACEDAAVCPREACRAGDGCTSMGPGCAKC